MRLLLLEDDYSLAGALVRGLTRHHATYDIRHVSRLEHATKLLSRESFDAALIDLTLPDAAGCEAAYALRKAQPALALVAMTACAFDSVAMELTTIGVQDFLQKSTLDIERIHQVLQLAAARHREQLTLQKKASTDPLTGVMNRSKIADEIERAIDLTNRTGSDAAMFAIDVDNFKWVNDNFGHRAGDILLVALVRELRSAMRTGDLIGRLGGDEFLIVAGGIHGHLDAASVALKFLRTVSGAPSLIIEGHNTTVSIGIALIPYNGKSIEELLTHADKSLYRAKRSGRNTHSF